MKKIFFMGTSPYKFRSSTPPGFKGGWETRYALIEETDVQRVKAHAQWCFGIEDPKDA